MSRPVHTDDPFKCPFYTWGFIAFVTGVIQLTLVPYIVHENYAYPSDTIFVVPGIVFFLVSILLWFFSTHTNLYKEYIIGKGMVFYAMFQLLVGFQKGFYAVDAGIYLIALALGAILLINSFYAVKVSIVGKFRDITHGLTIGLSLILIFLVGIPILF